MDLEATKNLSESHTIGNYILKSKLGESSFSTVWKAENKTTGGEVAVKQVYLSNLNKNLRNCLDCELNFLSSVNHPNIIRLLDVFEMNLGIMFTEALLLDMVLQKSIWSSSPSIMLKILKQTVIYMLSVSIIFHFCKSEYLQSQDECCMFLVLEFCSGGNLASYLQQHGRVQEKIAKRFTQQMGDGLKILQSHHIIHRDLKPENILLSGKESDVVLKIADFGLSRRVLPDNYVETVCGSPFYMAPEVLQFQRYDCKVDMWSVGVILFELLNGYPPFRGRTNFQVVSFLSCLPFSQHILPGLHPDCVDICSRLLSANPVQRLSFDEFYHHKFLRIKGVGKYHGQ
ncbi:hypothetical protein POTOM_058836 [Populus tomentosa]|uniref:Protein kinase domain-containing protein n=1 Tax=Populus tomentosa TaxID=118781 RepID=A0A8X7Y194_POPTO|nr:hypothetical protein POTOM_058836 [Populus tomentosa]